MLYSIFRNNSFFNILLQILCITVFIVITVDSVSEIVLKKNEPETGIIEDLDTKIILSAVYLSKVERQFLFEIFYENIIHKEIICDSSVKDRSPPEVNL